MKSFFFFHIYLFTLTHFLFYDANPRCRYCYCCGKPSLKENKNLMRFFSGLFVRKSKPIPSLLSEFNSFVYAFIYLILIAMQLHCQYRFLL